MGFRKTKNLTQSALFGSKSHRVGVASVVRVRDQLGASQSQRKLVQSFSRVTCEHPIGRLLYDVNVNIKVVEMSIDNIQIFLDQDPRPTFANIEIGDPVETIITSIPNKLKIV